jgi:PAS domain S-box-containing protein
VIESEMFSWPRASEPQIDLARTHPERYQQFLEAELKDRSEKLALAESSAGVGIWDIDIAAQTVRGTEQFFRLMGLPPTGGSVPIETIRALRIGEDRDRVVQGYVDTIAAGGESYESEYRIRRPDGEIRWIYGRGRVIRNAAGEPVRYSGVDIDITERKVAQAAQRDSQARLQLALDAAGLGVWEAVTDGNIKGSPELNRILGFEPGRDITADELRSRCMPGEYERLREIGQQAITAGERFIQVEFRIKWPDASMHWILLRAETQFNPDDKTLVGALGVAMDVTDRKEAEERQQLLMQELDHRVKNTLATVQAISHQTFRAVEDIPAATSAFNARLAALANAHGVLTIASWQSADLNHIVTGALQPFQDPERERFSTSGPSVYLSPQLALALAMTLHELCTNAVKYGALASAAGKVDLNWRLAGSPPRLAMRWVESGGPTVSPPKRTGFGSRMIKGGLAHAGDVQIDFPPDGVVCTIDIALEPTA